MGCHCLWERRKGRKELVQFRVFFVDVTFDLLEVGAMANVIEGRFGLQEIRQVLGVVGRSGHEVRKDVYRSLFIFFHRVRPFVW